MMGFYAIIEVNTKYNKRSAYGLRFTLRAFFTLRQKSIHVVMKMQQERQQHKARWILP